MENVSLQVVDSLDTFQDLAKRWSLLLQESSSRTIFLTWEWLFSWAEHFVKKRRELFIITVTEKDGLIGIAPWYRENDRLGPFTLRNVKFLGLPETGSDYLDVIVKKGKEKIVASRLYTYLMKESPSAWDSLIFREIPANSLFFLHFQNEFYRHGQYAEVYEGSYCPILKLPESRDAFFASLSANRRQQFRRHYKILSKMGELTHKTYFDGDVLGCLQAFAELYEKRWERDEKALFRFLDSYISRVQGSSPVQVDMLSVDGQDIAGIFHLNYGKAQYYYLMAVDKTFSSNISVGNVFLGLCIQNAIDARYREYDFLKGDEFHKFHWANHGERQINFMCYNKKIAPILLFSRRYLKRLGKIIFR